MRDRFERIFQRDAVVAHLFPVRGFAESVNQGAAGQSVFVAAQQTVYLSGSTRQQQSQFGMAYIDRNEAVGFVGRIYIFVLKSLAEHIVEIATIQMIGCG